MRVIPTQIEKQKTVADKVLDRLEAIDPTCIVAGGAPRDWYMGNPCNDIDVYVYSPNTATDFAQQMCKVGMPVHSRVVTSEDVSENYRRMPGLVGVYDLMVDGQPVQVMHMNEKTFQGVVSEFAMSISMFWYKDGQIVITDAARATLEYGIGYLADGYDDSVRYVKKIEARFPNIRWVKGRQLHMQVINSIR